MKATTDYYGVKETTKEKDHNLLDIEDKLQGS